MLVAGAVTLMPSIPTICVSLALLRSFDVALSVITSPRGPPLLNIFEAIGLPAAKSAPPSTVSAPMNPAMVSSPSPPKMLSLPSAAETKLPFAKAEGSNARPRSPV